MNSEINKKLTEQTESANTNKKNNLKSLEIKQNLTFGLLLIGLLVAGFSIGAVMNLLDHPQKENTIYTRKAEASEVNEMNK
ncbi:MAG: hypothetical protein AAGF07_02420 [Patescibacteria group bacterium]